MDLTPRHIQERQFHDSLRGYNHEEVDMFLDEVADAFERVFNQNQALLHQMRQIEENLQEARGSEDMLKRMLLTAQKTAEDAIEEARSKAQGMIVAAERKTQETIANAERRAQEIVAEAQTAERELQVHIEGLKRFDSEYRARLKAFIESQLRVLSEVPVATRTPERASLAPASLTEAGAASSPAAPSVSSAPASPATVAPDRAPTGPAPAPETPPQGPPRERMPVDEPVAAGEAAPAPEVPVGAGPGSREENSRPAPALSNSGPPGRGTQSGRSGSQEDDDEDRSIKELFWGDE